MAETGSGKMVCARSGHTVYPADNPVHIGGLVFHPAYFTCACPDETCNMKLKLQTAVVHEGDVYHKAHVPHAKPSGVMDVVTEGATQVPDSTFNTREFQKSDPNNEYGVDAVSVASQRNAPKPASTVTNANKLEQMHQGVEKFTST